MRGRTKRYFAVALGAALAIAVARCDDDDDDFNGPSLDDRPLDPQLVAQGKQIFRFDTFGDEVFWTDTARLHEVIRNSVSPTTALEVGLKVDVDTLPQAIRDAIVNGQIDLDSPATTVALLKLGAVLGVVGTVETVNGRDSLVRVGLTCALCHSTVDNSLAPGIGRRLDGYPNRDLNVGAIVALSPAITEAQKAVFNSWGKGKYDARFNFDGRNFPVVIPPAFGLRRVLKELYTGDDTISYWNNYVAVTQLHGQGTFIDPRLGLNIVRTPDLVTPKLAALREYQHSLETPRSAATDEAASARGRVVFNGVGRCATCHIPGDAFTDSNLGRLHDPQETGMDSVHAARSITKRYRTTPLRGLFKPPQLQGPYFHDGSAVTLEAVVDHYNQVMTLNLTAAQKADLVVYLKTL
jgi:mono/diheme cytochrome c family protein